MPYPCAGSEPVTNTRVVEDPRDRVAFQVSLSERACKSSGKMEKITFLPTVKAYPALSKTYGEVSCVAGVQFSPDQELSPHDLRWIRLYPIQFRDLEDNQQFAKYEPIEVEVKKHSSDNRPETRRPNRESIRILGKAIPADRTWQARRRFVEPLMAESMCSIQRAQAAHGTSLGIFRPKRVLGLEIEPVDIKAEKTEIARAWAAQGSLLNQEGADEKGHQLKALEQIPWRFKLRYECADPSCNGNHSQSIIDWEIAQFYRRVSRSTDWQQKLRHRVLHVLCGATRETALIVGNQHQHPTSFLILGFWWPQHTPDQLTFA